MEHKKKHIKRKEVKEMLNEHILKKISTISTKEAYDELLNSLKTSE